MKYTQAKGKMKTKTLGQKLMEQSRRANVYLTSDYWGSQLSYEGPGEYVVLHFKQKWGGMAIYRTSRIPASVLKECDTYENLEKVLLPERDCAPGDPMHYTARDVRRVPLNWTATE